jgi:phage antirepressor YoqD-like protein
MMNPQWLTMSQTALILGTTRNKLFEKMRRKKILKKSNQPQPEYINNMIFKLISYQKYNHNGDLLMVSTTIRVNSNQLITLAKLIR